MPTSPSHPISAGGPPRAPTAAGDPAGGRIGPDGFELESGEFIVASCRFDRDADLRFTDGQIVLLKPPSDSSLMASIQAWADAQPLPPEGFVSPVVLSFQPRA